LIFEAIIKIKIMYQAYQTCIDACLACVAACNYCAASCLQEKNIEPLSICIRLNLECASICKSAAELMSLGSNYANAACQVCADICHACAEECEKHDMDHCRQCAEACRSCAEECAGMIAA
jgi:hypothetical protein